VTGIFGLLFAAEWNKKVPIGALRQLGFHIRFAAAEHVRLDALMQFFQVAIRSRPAALVHVADVTGLAQIQGLADAAVAEFGRIDVWVNNAGGFSAVKGATAEWLDVTEAGWDAMLGLNLKAQVFGAQAAARAMRDGGNGGAIIFLSSIDSLYAAPGGEGIYGACKAAINNIVQTMAVELGQYGIRVNAIAPAVVETPLTAPWLATEADRRDRATFYPLRRVGQPADVAGAAVYFASDEAAWVSGAVLLVSGGSVMTSDPYRYLMRVNKG